MNQRNERANIKQEITKNIERWSNEFIKKVREN